MMKCAASCEEVYMNHRTLIIVETSYMYIVAAEEKKEK